VTSVAVWTAADGRSASTIYIVSDSRITLRASHYRDDCRKTFACSGSPDIFGYYGDVAVPLASLTRIEASSALAGLDSGDLRHSKFCALLKVAQAQVANSGAPFGAVHVTREGRGRNSVFRLWHTHWTGRSWQDEEIPAGDETKLLADLGSGAGFLSENIDAAQLELGNVSRAVFTGFCDSLAAKRDPKSGGAPQLVGLFRDVGMGRHFGVIFEGKPYFNHNPPLLRHQPPLACLPHEPSLKP